MDQEIINDADSLEQTDKDITDQNIAFDFEKNYFIPGISATTPKEKDQE